MNIVAMEPGTNFKPFVQIVTYGPDIGPLLMADFYYGYWYGNTAPVDDKMTRRQFSKRVRKGKLLCHALHGPDRLLGVFGTAIEADDEGPYVEIQFFLAEHLREKFREVIRAMAMRTYWVARMEQQSRYEYAGYVRMRARGRKGWKRALASVGVNIDDDGWCRDFDPIARWRKP